MTIRAHWHTLTDAENVLSAQATDHFATGGCGPTELEASMLFGNHTAGLTALYREEIDAVSEALGCCSRQLCAHYGIATNCSIADLPTTFTGPDDYWDSMYSNPLSIAAYFSEAFMLQALSGLQYAWGSLSQSQLMRLYGLHERVQRLASSRVSSEAFGSAYLAYALASFEQVIHGSALPGVLQPPSESLFFALFAHDFNLMYLRRLLGVSWLTDGWDFNAVPPGAFVTFELWKVEAAAEPHRPAEPSRPAEPYRQGERRRADAQLPDARASPAPSSDGATEEGPAPPSASPEYRVRGSFTAASFAQQRAASPLTPPS